MKEKSENNIYRVFKEYYLTYLVFYIVIVALFYFTNKTESDFDRFRFMSIFMILFLMLIGTLEFFSHIYYRPWKIKKILELSPFKEFIEKGFVNDGNNIIGVIDDYTVMLGVLWPNDLKRYSLYYQVLFNPYVRGQFIKEKEYDSLRNEIGDKSKILALNSIIKYYNKNEFFIDTSYETVNKDIMNSIYFLQEKKIESISFVKWEEKIPEIEKYSRSLQNLSY